MGAEKNFVDVRSYVNGCPCEDVSPHIKIRRVWPAGGRQSKPDYEFMTSVVARSDMFMNAGRSACTGRLQLIQCYSNADEWKHCFFSAGAFDLKCDDNETAPGSHAWISSFDRRGGLMRFSRQRWSIVSHSSTSTVGYLAIGYRTHTRTVALSETVVFLTSINKSFNIRDGLLWPTKVRNKLYTGSVRGYSFG